MACSNNPLSISVFWLEGDNGGLEQVFVVQYRPDTSTQWINVTEVFSEKSFQTNRKVDISNLKPNTRYLLRVLAYNKYGYRDFSKETEALTSPGKIIIF